MNTEEFNEVSGHIAETMQSAGRFKFGSKEIREGDTSLLYPTEETLFEHWQIHQGALAYYGYLLNYSQNALQDAEEQLKLTVLGEEGKLFELAKVKYGLSRPSRDDAFLIGIIEGREDITQLHENVRYWREKVGMLEYWFKSWEKKSFVLNKMSETAVMNKIGAGSPSDFQKALIQRLNNGRGGHGSQDESQG